MLILWKIAKDYAVDISGITLLSIEFHAANVVYVEFNVYGKKQSTYIGLWECMGDIFQLLLKNM